MTIDQAALRSPLFATAWRIRFFSPSVGMRANVASETASNISGSFFLLANKDPTAQNFGVGAPLRARYVTEPPPVGPNSNIDSLTTNPANV